MEEDFLSYLNEFSRKLEISKRMEERMLYSIKLVDAQKSIVDILPIPEKLAEEGKIPVYKLIEIGNELVRLSNGAKSMSKVLRSLDLEKEPIPENIKQDIENFVGQIYYFTGNIKSSQLTDMIYLN